MDERTDGQTDGRTEGGHVCHLVGMCSMLGVEKECTQKLCQELIWRMQCKEIEGMDLGGR